MNNMITYKIKYVVCGGLLFFNYIFMQASKIEEQRIKDLKELHRKFSVPDQWIKRNLIKKVCRELSLILRDDIIIDSNIRKEIQRITAQYTTLPRSLGYASNLEIRADGRSLQESIRLILCTINKPGNEPGVKTKPVINPLQIEQSLYNKNLSKKFNDTD